MIEIENLHVRFNSDQGEVHAVRGVDISVKPGEFYTLLGPSGCGKTTTLRCLAGLERPSEGRITVADTVVFDSHRGVAVPTHKRDLGMVFQSYAIWPHLTVFENVAFPLREMRPRLDESTIAKRVTTALELVQLGGYESRPAPFLSGGQQQRLALARAIVREATVVLFDEPLSNLDAKLRAETRLELRDLVKRLNMTALYVTHDQTEALTMADRVAVMHSGEIAQESSPVEIYQHPQNRFVASFIGQINFIDGTVREVARDNAPGAIDTAWGTLAYYTGPQVSVGDAVTVAIRPENLMVGLNGSAPPGNRIQGEIAEIVFLGEALECRVAKEDSHLDVRVHPSTKVSVGSPVELSFGADDVSVLTS